MKTYLMNLVDELDFPPESKIVISDGYDLINVNDELSAFCTKYESNELDWSEAVNEITVLAEKINLHKYIAHMIFFLCMSKHTLKLYEEKGLTTSYLLILFQTSDISFMNLTRTTEYGAQVAIRAGTQDFSSSSVLHWADSSMKQSPIVAKPHTQKMV